MKRILVAIVVGFIFVVVLILIMNYRCWDRGCSYALDNMLLFMPKVESCNHGYSSTSYCNYWYLVPLAVYCTLGGLIGYVTRKKSNY